MPNDVTSNNADEFTNADNARQDAVDFDFTPIDVGNVENVEDLRDLLARTMKQIDQRRNLSVEMIGRLSPSVLDSWDKLRRECENLSRSMNLLPSIGVVGNVASGKTSVVEMLHGQIGGPLFSSVGQNATTGNIVEYNLLYEPNDVRTEPSYDDWNVIFLSDEDINKLTSTYREEIVKGARDVIELTELVKFEKLCNDVDCKNQSWNARWHELRRWAIETYNGLDSERYGSLRKAIYELFLLAECAYVYHDWFGRTEKISYDQASALLNLSADNTPPPELAERNNLLGHTEIEKVSAKEIRNLFFLVKRLRTTVRTSQVAAETFAVRNSDGAFRMRIIDCPGLGAPSSPIRDRALCLEQLKDLDVVLMLLDVGAQGHSDAAKILVDKIDPNGTLGILKRVVVAINKFDSILMTPMEKNKIAQIDKFTDEQDALSNFSSFQAVYTSALGVLNNTLNAPKSIAFLSPYCFVGRRQEFATRDFIEQSWNGAFAESCADSCKKLKEYADKIPPGILRDAFDAFLQDGGTTRLRDVYVDLIQHSGRLHQTARLNRNLRELIVKWNALKPQIELELSVPEESCSDEEITPEQTLNALKKLESLIDGLASASSIWRKLFDYYVNHKKKQERKEITFEIFLSKFWKAYFRVPYFIDGAKISLAERGKLAEKTDDKELIDGYFNNLREVANRSNDYIRQYATPYSFRDYVVKQNVLNRDNLDGEIDLIIRSVRKAQTLKEKYGKTVEFITDTNPDPLASLAHSDILNFDRALTALFSDRLLQELENWATNEWDYQKYYPLQMKRAESSFEQGAFFPWSDQKRKNQNIVVLKRQMGSLGVVAVQNLFVSNGLRFVDDFLEESKARVFNNVKSICDSFRMQIDYYVGLAENWKKDWLREKSATRPTVAHPAGLPPSTPTDDELNDYLNEEF